MLADFLEPFWEWLFDKTGVFGLVIASSAPILILVLGAVLITVIYIVMKSIVSRSRKKRQEKLRHLAILYWDQEEYDEAVELFLKLAKMRPLTAEEKYIMALICADGEDNGWLYTSREYMEDYWLRQAVKEEYPDAMEYAAYKELLSAKDMLQAAKAVWKMRSAQKKGSMDAKEHLDEYEKRMRENGANDMLVGLIMGNADIQLAYGEKEFETGDAEEAMEWLMLAGEYGSVNAINLAGIRYMEGDGVKKNLREGERLLKKAGGLDSAGACRVLGSAYCAGIFGKRDFSMARDWLEKAVELDEKDDVSMFVLAMCYEEMLNDRMKQLNFDQNAIMGDSPCKRYTEEHFNWLKKAAALGNQEAKAKQEEFYNASEYGRAVRIIDKMLEKKEK